MTEIRPTCPADVGEVLTLMQRRALLPTGDLQARTRLFHWQYFTPRPDWSGPRSYIAQRDGRILAHAGFLPATLVTPHGSVSTMSVNDWVADRQNPGAGVRLFKQVVRLVDCPIAVGGSANGQALIPRLGFEARGAVVVFMLPVRPLREFCSQPFTWKSPLRLIRSIRYRRRPAAAPGWSACRLERFDAGQDRLFPNPGNAFSGFQRSGGLLNYFLECPSVPLRAYLLRRNGEVNGYFLAARNGPDGRIVDLSVNSERAADWSDAYRTAAAALAKEPQIGRLIASSSAPLLVQALRQSGFHELSRIDLKLLDPGHRYSAALPLNYQMLEGDSWFA